MLKTNPDRVDVLFPFQFLKLQAGVPGVGLKEPLGAFGITLNGNRQV